MLSCYCCLPSVNNGKKMVHRVWYIVSEFIRSFQVKLHFLTQFSKTLKSPLMLINVVKQRLCFWGCILESIKCFIYLDICHHRQYEPLKHFGLENWCLLLYEVCTCERTRTNQFSSLVIIRLKIQTYQTVASHI